MERHLDANVWAEHQLGRKLASISQICREKLALIADQGSGHELEIVVHQSRQDKLAVRHTAAASFTSARGGRHGDLKVDILRKPLDEAPSLG
jgi:hypothetical protein